MEIREPLGCIAILCGRGAGKDAHPLLKFVLHLIGAISYGNTVIIVPDEKFPLPALDLYEIFDTSDMPGGVVNILTGGKHHLCKYLSEHQQVNSVWYIYNADLTPEEQTALQFVKQTNGFSLKRSWLVSGDLPMSNGFVNATYLNEIDLNATQSKFVHIPMGTIFAN